MDNPPESPASYPQVFFFLSHLSLLDLSYSKVITPKTLENLLIPTKYIPYMNGFTQLYFFVFLGVTECSSLLHSIWLLCSYLHSSAVSRCCVHMMLLLLSFWILFDWFHGLLCQCAFHEHTGFLQLQYNPSLFMWHIPNFSLVLYWHIRHGNNGILCSWLTLMASLITILVSYVSILSTILKITSTTGKK